MKKDFNVFSLLLALIGSFLLGAGVVLITSPAFAQPTAPIVPAGAHPIEYVEIDGSGIGIESRARKLALAKQCAALTGKAEATLTPDIEDGILSNAADYTEIASNKALDCGKSRVGVSIFLAFPKSGKQGLLRALMQKGLVRPLRVAVVVPEEHRIETRFERVPDPAGETSLAAHLEATGFTGMDPKLAEKLKDDATVRAALRGDLNEEQFHALKNRLPGIDILVVGEAFSVEVRGIRTTSGMPTCEANVEVKALDLATGGRVYSGREKAFAFSLSGAGAGKAALQKAGELLAPRVADGLLLWMADKRNTSGVGGSVTVKLEVAGLAGARQRDGFLDAIRALPGVEVVSDEWEGGILFAQLKVERTQSRKLAGKMEELPGFRFVTSGDSGGLIKGAVKQK